MQANPHQLRALYSIYHMVQRHMDLSGRKRYGGAITRWKFSELSHGTGWLEVSTELLGLPEGNTRRHLDEEIYLFKIGTRGKITASMMPKAYRGRITAGERKVHTTRTRFM